MNQFYLKNFLKIKNRTQETGHKNLKELEADYDWLYGFTKHVIEEIGLDVTDRPTYFDDAEPLLGAGTPEELTQHLVVGQEAKLFLGLYTHPETYRKIPIDYSGNPCTKCRGKGCEDYFGEDCAADGEAMIRVRDLKDKGLG